MLVIGITGGVASGKSLVAGQLQSLGAHVLDADKAGHQVLRLPHVIDAVREKWGSQVVSKNEVNRQRLAELVFQDNETSREDLAQLEAITHPQIREILISQLSRLRDQQDVPAVVLDAPIMFKAGWDELCDKIVFVEAPLGARQIRAVETRGWDESELAKRENRQLDLDQKRFRATDFIDNSTTVEACWKQVKTMWNRWGLPPHCPTKVNPTNTFPAQTTNEQPKND